MHRSRGGGGDLPNILRMINKFTNTLNSRNISHFSTYVCEMRKKNHLPIISGSKKKKILASHINTCISWEHIIFFYYYLDASNSPKRLVAIKQIKITRGRESRAACLVLKTGVCSYPQNCEHNPGSKEYHLLYCFQTLKISYNTWKKCSGVYSMKWHSFVPLEQI